MLTSNQSKVGGSSPSLGTTSTIKETSWKYVLMKTKRTQHKNPFPRIHEVHNKSSNASVRGTYKISGEIFMAWIYVLSKVEKHGTG